MRPVALLATLAGLALAIALPAARARDVYIEPDAPVVALVLGDTIRLRNPDDVRQAIVVRLRERYAAEKGIAAEPAEVAAQAEALRQTLSRDRVRWNTRLEEIDRRLRERSLSPAERKALADERGVLVTLLRHQEGMPPAPPPLEDSRILNALATGIVLQWKVDRALYRQYGGRIARQPGGLEPVDAYRRFLEERRDRGEFQILVAEVERAFWVPFRPGPQQVFLAAGGPEEARAFAVPPWK